MKEKVLHSIFLDKQKACNALYRDLCLDILVGYVLGPRTLRILRTYWVRIHMAKKAGVHYGLIFQSHYGVTQGDPL